MPGEIAAPQQSAAAAMRSRAAAAGQAAPGILLNTLPKSGSIYLLTYLSKALHLQQKSVALGYFPNDLADWQGIKAIGSGGRIAQTHLDASPANLQIFEYYLRRWIVHIRDPRQALLSWVHHLVKHRSMREDLPLESCPAPPQEYYDYTLGRQIDWQIGVFLPQAVRWIEDWLAYARSMRASVLITTFEDLVRSEPVFIRTVMAFYGVQAHQALNVEVTKNDATHFRAGQVDEWMEVFTPDQARRAAKVIPETLLNEFRWRA